MNSVYRAIGISKQSFHQRMDRHLQQLELQAQLEWVVKKIRQDHPRMSSRHMYRMLKPKGMGRDRFEKWCHDLGLKVKTKRSFRRTTNSIGVTRFVNRIKELELRSVNQVWVSDITYYRIKESFYYITLMMDLYSRRLIGYSVSKDLFTESTTIPALRRAIKTRKGQILEGLIIHSDGGGQYYSKSFIQITKTYGMLNSMAEDVYENPHAERINGTIKNDYLRPYDPQNYKELKQMTMKAIKLYNGQKPHKGLNYVSPIFYESKLLVN